LPHELARFRRCRAGKIALLAEHHGKAPPGGVARDPGSVDAAANNEEIDVDLPFHQSARGIAVAGLSIAAPIRAGRAPHRSTRKNHVKNQAG
jgi:hypothetical protein